MQPIKIDRSARSNWMTRFIERLPEDLKVNDDVIRELVRVNDDVTLSMPEREEKIVRIFRNAGITVTFVGAYAEESVS